MQRFDYKGFTAEYLENICSEEHLSPFNTTSKHWTSQAYSMGKFLCEYGFYPDFLPLYCHAQHGVSFCEDIVTSNFELNITAPLNFYFDEDYVQRFQKKFKRTFVSVPAPLPWLRKKHKLEKKSNVKGTLAFFQHTTHHMGFAIDDAIVVDDYINDLMLLPEHMHPICVCLHMCDVNRGIHKYFIEKDIPVYSTGNMLDKGFFKSFYDILLNFRYTTSVNLGSHMFYSVEADIPFVKHGKCVEYKIDTDLDPSVNECKEHHRLFFEVEKHFSGNSGIISQEQRELSNILLNTMSNTSRLKVSFLLYRDLMQHFFCSDLKKNVKNIIKKKLPKFAVEYLKSARDKFKARVMCEAFNPTWVGIFTNPFYFARKGLSDNIKQLAPKIYGRCLDVGCGTKPYEKYYTNVTEYIGMEHEGSRERYKNGVVDFFYDNLTFPFEDASFNSVVSTQVMEHVENPTRYLIEINRVLQDNGLIILSVPCIGEEHEQPYDFQRYTSFGMEKILQKHGFEILEIKKSCLGTSAIFFLIGMYIYKITIKLRKNRKCDFICNLFLNAPFNILGCVLKKMLPQNEDFFLDSVVLARKTDTVKVSINENTPS